MAFLRLNGWDIPVEADSPGLRRLGIGSKARAFSGTLLSDRRTTKRIWDMRTTPQKEIVAKSIEGILDGLGDGASFDFSDSANLTPDFFTGKGVGKVSGTNGSIRFGVGADGAGVVDSNGKDESKIGTGSLSSEKAATNILLPNTRDAEASGGHALVGGAAVSFDTTHFIQGAQSVKAVTSGVGDGVETKVNDTVASSSTQYWGSVYVKTTVARALTVNLRDNTTTIGTANFTTVANKWNLLSVSGTTGVSATRIALQVLDNASGGTTYYCDAWQIEVQGSLGFSTAWVDGVRAADDDLEYPTSLIEGFSDLTINFWAKFKAGIGSSRTVLDITKPGVGVLSITVSGSNPIFWRTRDDSGGNVDDIQPSVTWDGDWHMVTLVIRKNPETGENIKEIYFDGVSVGNSNPSGIFSSTGFSALQIGHSAGFGQMADLGPIDGFSILPYAAPATLVSAWHSAVADLSTLPRLTLDGDIIPETSITVEGEVARESYIAGGVDSGVFIGNARQIEFTLEET